MIPELIIALSAGAAMFGVGLYGALSQTNPGEPAGQMFVLIVMAVMAVEMAVGFGIAIARFRSRGSVEMEEARELKG